MSDVKHFLDISDYTPAEIQDMLDLALRLRRNTSRAAIRRSSRARCWG